MKQQVIYIHGGDSFSDYEQYLRYLATLDIVDLPGAVEPPKRWSKTLRENMGEEFEVFTPLMPNKLRAQYPEWKIWFEKHFEYLHDDIILIGWSLGGLFLVKYLTENEFPFKIKALILMSAVYGDGSLVDEDGDDGGDFLHDVSEIPRLQKKIENIVIMHSQDDFVVPYDHALKYQAALPEAELITFEDKTHFLVEELPELLEKIKEISRK